MGDPSDPLSLNRYVYCGLDPVNYVDPTGFFLLPLLGFAFGQALPPPDAPVSDVLASGLTGAFLFTAFGEAYNAYKFSQLMNSGTLADAETASTKVNNAKEAISDWLGKDSRLIKNSSGDTVILSADGTRRVRFDILNPFPHANPHSHIEELIDGKWVKSGPIYPIDVPQN